ncbi:hypothetical protein G7Z17_g10228 [Cylindrodendrum hubeiense]|uniref:Transcription factor domain-containing protein n=1 Tax=Cylindrodendrum hubeiense TaxID=595255 RepID=A0A9P5GZ25_9HYPO|nr:hypothetical protein G7Z17_g10228 [Cylindrodendrum hubeiense]
MPASPASEKRRAVLARSRPAQAVSALSRPALIHQRDDRHTAADQTKRTIRHEQAIEEEVAETSEKSYSASPPAPEPNYPVSHPSTATFDSETSNLRPCASDISIGIDLYFKYCHRQPIWCFDREEVSDYASIPEELACSILALTSRFSDNRDQAQLHGNIAKSLIMLRIANGTVDLTIIESLCLLSYSAFMGVWNTSVHLGWVWSQVRKYVSDCSRNKLVEPWRYDSTYAKVLSDFMETENRIPMCHRYDSVKFYERKVEEVRMNRDYYAPWLKEQFTYHSIHTVLNHPFLYIVGAQHNPNLAIPNTFWRRSSELALLHSTWIVRMIDMVVDKQVPLVDPFFGHVAAIAATVHLYYCCAAATKLKHKSNTDFAKCRRFLKSFIPSSEACRALDRNLDKMTRIAAGSESMDVEDWMPSRIYLSVPLMWDILQFNSTADTQEAPTAGLLDVSLAPAVAQEETGELSTLEIIVATSPEITINTADGGQQAPTLSCKPPPSSSRDSSRSAVCDEPSVEQVDSLAFTTTPWLYADSSQLFNIADMGFSNSQPAIDEEATGMGWWEDENFGNPMFDSF